jgi:hypothetical protein
VCWRRVETTEGAGSKENGEGRDEREQLTLKEQRGKPDGTGIWVES